MSFIARLLVNALSLWVVVLILDPNIQMNSWNTTTDATVADLGGVSWPLLGTYLLISFIFGVVNGIIGTAIKIVAFPLYILTFGLISLLVNGLLLLIVAWLSGLIGFGLSVTSLGWGVLGALLLGSISWVIGIILRPLTKYRRR